MPNARACSARSAMVLKKLRECAAATIDSTPTALTGQAATSWLQPLKLLCQGRGPKGPPVQWRRGPGRTGACLSGVATAHWPALPLSAHPPPSSPTIVRQALPPAPPHWRQLAGLVAAPPVDKSATTRQGWRQAAPSRRMLGRPAWPGNGWGCWLDLRSDGQRKWGGSPRSQRRRRAGSAVTEEVRTTNSSERRTAGGRAGARRSSPIQFWAGKST